MTVHYNVAAIAVVAVAYDRTDADWLLIVLILSVGIVLQSKRLRGR